MIYCIADFISRQIAEDEGSEFSLTSFTAAVCEKVSWLASVAAANSCFNSWVGWMCCRPEPS